LAYPVGRAKAVRVIRNTFQILFVLLLLTALYLALTPQPIGMLIESGETRHALAFAILPLISSIAWPRLPIVPHFLGYSVFGGLIEIAQFEMHVGRNAEWVDWITDIVVAAITLILCRIVALLVARRAIATG
jgi:VanZ family protein